MFDFLYNLFNFTDRDYKLRCRLSVGDWDDAAITKSDLQRIRLLLSQQLDAVQTDIAMQRVFVGRNAQCEVDGATQSLYRNQLSALQKKRKNFESTLRNVKATLATLP